MEHRFNGYIEPWRLNKLRRALTRWINNMLGETYIHIQELERDVADSLVVIFLLTKVLDEPVWNGSQYLHKFPRKKDQMIENMESVFKLLERRGVSSFCKAPEFVGGMPEKVMPMLLQVSWYHYTKKLFGEPTSYEELRKELLQMVRSTLRNHPTVNADDIVNFSDSFEDGSVLAALVHSFDNSVYNWNDVKNLSAREKVDAAVMAAHNTFNVGMVVDGQDVSSNPEELSIMLYVASLFTGVAEHAANMSRYTGERAMEIERTNAIQEKQISAMHEKIAELTAENSGLKSRNDALNLELYDKETATVGIDDRLVSLREENKELRQALDSQHQQQSQLMAVKDGALVELTERVKDLLKDKTIMEMQLARALEEGQKAARDLARLNSMVVFRLEEERGRDDSGIEPPQGEVTIVFTDVQGSTRLWETYPEATQKALHKHNALVRAILRRYGGYEVKFEGDSFMMAFQDAFKAVECMVMLQKVLLECEWPDELLLDEECCIERDEMGVTINRGFRVRVGMHCGDVRCLMDPVTRRMDYFGPVVNRAARLEGAAFGGQILISGEIMESIESQLELLSVDGPHDLGAHSFRGLATPVRVLQVLPRELRARKFPEIEGNTEHLASHKLASELDAARAENSVLIDHLTSMTARYQQICEEAENVERQLRFNSFGAYEQEQIRQAMNNMVELVQLNKRNMEDARTATADNLELKEQVNYLADEVSSLHKMLSAEAKQAKKKKGAPQVEQFLEKAREDVAFKEEKSKYRQQIEDLRAQVRGLEEKLAFEVKQRKRMLSRGVGNSGNLSASAPTESKRGERGERGERGSNNGNSIASKQSEFSNGGRSRPSGEYNNSSTQSLNSSGNHGYGDDRGGGGGGGGGGGERPESAASRRAKRGSMEITNYIEEQPPPVLDVSDEEIFDLGPSVPRTNSGNDLTKSGKRSSVGSYKNNRGRYHSSQTLPPLTEPGGDGPRPSSVSDRSPATRGRGVSSPPVPAFGRESGGNANSDELHPGGSGFNPRRHPSSDSMGPEDGLEPGGNRYYSGSSTIEGARSGGPVDDEGHRRRRRKHRRRSVDIKDGSSLPRLSQTDTSAGSYDGSPRRLM